MHAGWMKAAKVGVALATAGAVLTGGVAQAQYYSYAAPAPAGYVRVGPADPCARTAAQRALGWGIVGLVAGGLAGGAAAGAGVVAEGAGLGAFVGSIIGGVAGSRSAACGTAALAARAGAYPPYGQPYGGYGANYYPTHPTYAYGGAQPVTYYEYRRTYRSYTTEAAPPAYYPPAPQPYYGPQGGYYDQGYYAQQPPQYQQPYEPPQPIPYQGPAQPYPRN